METTSTHQLSFGKAIYHGNGLLELIASEGVEIKIASFEEMIALLDDLVPRPAKRALLANRENSYSFTYDAVPFAAKSKAIDVLAVLSHSRLSMIAASVFKPLNFPFKVFTNHNEAMSWLRSKIESPEN